MDFFKESLILHEKYNGKLKICSKVEIKDKKDLSIFYSPGVASPCLEIKKNEENFKKYTSASKTVAVISDGSAVLGLGDIGHKASMPVMEGKAVLFKRFAGVDSFPIIINTKDVNEFVDTVTRIADSFGGINLEDISSPRCFEIEKKLKERLEIPVFHDDQHGTAIVTLAGIINYLKISNKDIKKCKVVINGSGAAGGAILELLKNYGLRNIIICDRKGSINSRRGDLTEIKKYFLSISNPFDEIGDIHSVITGADIFIGVSSSDILDENDIKRMNNNPAIFAMANPNPEIKPEKALRAGALVVGTGRSDYPNQLNNVLVFPGIFKGALESGAKKITQEMKIRAAKALAGMVENPSPDRIIPSPFEDGVSEIIAKEIIEEVKLLRLKGKNI